MRHVLAVRPDIMKLDRSLIQSIDANAMPLALTTALVTFAGQFNCQVTAEGIETPDELEVLRRLAIQAVQGYLLDRPMPASALAELLRAAQTGGSVGRTRRRAAG